MWEYFIFGGITLLMTGVRCEVTEVFVKAGDLAVLPCKSFPPSPSAAAVYWVKDKGGTVWRKQKSGLQYWGSTWSQDGTPRAQCPYSEFGRGDYSLHITNVREEDGGNYTCRVLDGGNVDEQKVTLRVVKMSVSPPVPTLGNDVSISCNITPWPRGAILLWRLNESPFASQNGMRAVPRPGRDITGYVMMGKATERISGNWTCEVLYRGQTQTLVTVPLSVKGIVQPSSDNTKVYAAVGSAVTLPCVFSPSLILSGPTWEKLSSGSRSPSTPDFRPASFTPSPSSSQQPWDRSVSVGEVGVDDEGTYRCSGTAGGYKLSRTLQLVVARSNKISSKKKATVTLTCLLSDESEVTDYKWVHVTHDFNGSQSERSVQTGKVLKIDKMAEENSGEWACRFYGEKGILGNVTYHIPLMSGLTGESATGISNNTGTVIGLSFLLVVLLLILAQMYKNHQRRKRIFQYPALETIVHTIANEREERDRNRAKN
uniref:Ig-like domain-containing protein n=1 Tax=Myripristis murdjan TaxID=586833 RepID=A0A667X4L4_9TELE